MLLKILGMKNKNIRFFKKKKWGMKWKEDKKPSSNKSISSWQDSLSCSDDKQYILDGRIKVLLYEHKHINYLLWLVYKSIINFWSDQFSYFDWFIKLQGISVLVSLAILTVSNI